MLQTYWTCILLILLPDTVQGQITASSLQSNITIAIHNAARELGDRKKVATTTTQASVPLYLLLMRLYSRRNVSPEKIQSLSDQSTVLHHSALALVKKYNLDPSRIFEESTLTVEYNKQMPTICRYARPPCDRTYPYRLPDGTCNNLLDSLLGASVTPLQRIVSSSYTGINGPRSMSSDGVNRLPSPREVSNKIHARGKSYEKSSFITAMFTHWGQFVDHDMISVPEKLDANGQSLSCCPKQNETMHPECFPLSIPVNDPRFVNESCMHFVRSETAPPLECVFAPRQQVNQRTAFLDGSAVYGNSKEQEDSLRDLSSRGLMKTSQHFNLMPSTANPTDPNLCRIDPMDVGVGAKHCFDAGDHRNTETPALASLHVLMLREHNRIATILGRLNAHWTNESVYQETKKIITGLIQHITYNEFLPILLSDVDMQKFGLASTVLGFNTIYNDQLDPRIINAFGIAAHPFLSSLLTGSVGHADFNFTTIRNFTLRDHYFRPLTVWMGEGRGADFYARWMTDNTKSKSDRFIEQDLRNYLYYDPKTGKSFDLAAITIQRGRDHGLPGYNVYRQYCGLQQAIYFGPGRLGLQDHPPDVIPLLKDLYKVPDDIDVFTGGITERPLPGSLLGPTLSCLIGLQYHLLKFGDRFWYENGFLETGFTLDQLNSIKQQSLAKIMCRNFDIHSLQPAAFIVNSQANSRLPCSEYGDLNLEFWQDMPMPFIPGPFTPGMMALMNGVPRPNVPPAMLPAMQPTQSTPQPPATEAPPFNPQLLQLLRNLAK